jgi:hypothetical protein
VWRELLTLYPSHLFCSPPVELVLAGSLTAAKGIPDNPQDEQHDGNNPQDMQREPSAKENKHQQQSQKQNHGNPPRLS